MQWWGPTKAFCCSVNVHGVVVLCWGGGDTSTVFVWSELFVPTGGGDPKTSRKHPLPPRWATWWNFYCLIFYHCNVWRIQRKSIVLKIRSTKFHQFRSVDQSSVHSQSMVELILTGCANGPLGALIRIWYPRGAIQIEFEYVFGDYYWVRTFLLQYLHHCCIVGVGGRGFIIKLGKLVNMWKHPSLGNTGLLSKKPCRQVPSRSIIKII